MNKKWFFGGITILLVFLFQTQFYRLRSLKEMGAYKLQLERLGERALETNDVPVGALLIYKDSIIGSGFNTVRREGALSAHAEMNAIDMAYRNLGNAFFTLDRNELELYSTFEPCEMCKGMLVHYDVQRVYFERKKQVGRQLKSTWKQFLYEIKKKRVDADSLQEKLFLKHPDYKTE